MISAPEEFRMTITLDQLAEALQTLFTTEADQAAQDSGMIRRRRKLTGAAFVQALVFHWLEDPHSKKDSPGRAACKPPLPGRLKNRASGF
jgi:hypothetical protein